MKTAPPKPNGFTIPEPIKGLALVALSFLIIALGMSGVVLTIAMPLF